MAQQLTKSIIGPTITEQILCRHAGQALKNHAWTQVKGALQGLIFGQGWTVVYHESSVAISNPRRGRYFRLQLDGWLCYDRRRKDGTFVSTKSTDDITVASTKLRELLLSVAATEVATPEFSTFKPSGH